MTSSVLESAKFIAAHSKDVVIPPAGIKHAADFIMDQMTRLKYSCANWKQHPLNPKDNSDSTVDWIFLVDLLNFSFFSDMPKGREYAVTFGDKRYTGYWTLCASVNRALEENIPVTLPAYFAQMDMQKMKYVFRPDPTSQEDIPLIDERLRVLRETGNILNSKYAGSFVNCIKEANRSAQSLLRLIVDTFPSFRDEHTFHGRQVYIYKRAQILISDIWACFEGKGLGQFDDIDTITMFADYRVPQALVGIGALTYSQRLLDIINDSNHSLESGDPLEVEIRGNSIWAVELIRQEIRKRSDEPPNAIMIDFFLWDFAKANAEKLKDIPIHKTRSIFY